ncbi:MAG: DUF177 domain-containing protein [Rhodothermales bacterium]
MFSIDIGALEPGVHALAFEPDVEAVDLGPETFADVKVDARLDVAERRILVSLEVRATATLECDRTLRMFDKDIGGTYHLLFAPPEFLVQDDDAYDEVRELDPADTEIDVTEVVRDTILLAVPVRTVAPGAEDEEIPTEFGAPADEDEIDPRWAALKELKPGAKQD